MTPQGRAEIRERITAAARQVCAVETRLAVQLNSQRRACMAQAIETAEAQLEIKFAQASQSRLARGAEPVAENG
jgi:UrcA family protein